MEREFHVDGRTFSHRGLGRSGWFRQGGKSSWHRLRGVWVGPQEAGEGVWIPQRVFQGSDANALLPPYVLWAHLFFVDITIRGQPREGDQWPV